MFFVLANGTVSYRFQSGSFKRVKDANGLSGSKVVSHDNVHKYGNVVPRMNVRYTRSYILAKSKVSAF